MDDLDKLLEFYGVHKSYSMQGPHFLQIGPVSGDSSNYTVVRAELADTVLLSQEAQESLQAVSWTKKGVKVCI